jgi:DNA-binding NtrC family response regulator
MFVAPISVWVEEVRWMQVFLIDDEPIVLQTLTSFLNDLGHTVTCSSSKDELEAIGNQTEADLVIADLRLPGLNGLKLIRRVHQLFPDTPIVVISGHRADLLSTQDAVECEVFAFLHKPFSLRELEFLLIRLEKEQKSSGGLVSVKVESSTTPERGGGR